jgi:chromatin remodeling complex protein RSC6
MTAASKTTQNKKAPKAKTQVAKTEKKTTTKASTPVVETPAAPAPAVAPVTDSNEPVVSIESSMTDVLSGFVETIQTLNISLNKLKSEFKVIEKRVLREARSMDKVNARRNKNKGSRAPSGFVKPASISKDLAKFLGVPEDTMMARTDVTKMITSYVKEHKLQDNENGRKIVPDAKLKALLNIKAGEEVTYFNLQKYMKPHFLKA